jgi:hypothetical protein
MGRTGTPLVVLGAALLILFGCKHDDNLKPPKQDPQFGLPPNDPRYSSYPKFPDSTLNKWPKKDAPTLDDPTAAPAALEKNRKPSMSMGGMGGPGG